ncbi:Integrator complex subunit 4 [Mortierella alpina]|nr:Integrator complex subunit 4 [Mortierella alpina]
MKRAIQNANPAGGREKHGRILAEAEATAGSHTLVQHGPVLSLQTAGGGDRDDMVLGEDRISGQEQDESMEEDEDVDESDTEDFDLASTETLLQALDSPSSRARIKALKLLLNRLSDLTEEERTRLVENARRKLYSEGDKGAKILLIQVLQNALEATRIDGRGVVEDLLNQVRRSLLHSDWLPAIQKHHADQHNNSWYFWQLQADSTEVRVQVYDAISYIIKIGRLPRNSTSDINTIRALIITSIADLKDRHHRIRSAVLQLISRLAPLLTMSEAIAMSSQQGYSRHDIQVIISNYATDPEPRVRKNALKALLEIHRQGFRLALVMYDVCILALIDDYQEVRMEGLDLIYILSGLYPEQTVQDPQATQLQATRLVDDAFIRICDMVNDSSMTVRAKACSYLGRFKSVDYKFLSQTFSKQIMARLKVDVAPRNLAAGPAQKQAQRAKLIATPEGDQDVTAQQVRLLDSGACGAFVHGLEDEYQDVRNAAINSICELCLHNPEFSLLALDYMVDMFMDEIDYVRLNALTSLCKIGNKAPITFDTEQLQIALGVLEDADRDVRESAHRMLGVVTMATADGMPHFLASLESNMNRFPEDQLSIYQCIRAVARRHGAFIEGQVTTMLHLDKTFLPIEANVEDMLYGGHLVLIFNAAIPSPRILQMLPKYTFKHYTYLRDKYPDCFPEPTEIPCPGTQPLRDLASALTMTIAKAPSADMEIDDLELGSHVTAMDSASSAYATTIAAMRVQTEEDAESFYERALQNLGRIHTLSCRLQQLPQQQSLQQQRLRSSHRTMLFQQIRTCQRDLHYIVSVHAKQARSAEFVSMYLECCELLARIQDSHDSPSFVMMAPMLSAQLFRLSYYMDHIFLGLDATSKVSVRYFRVLANLVWFVGMVQKSARESTGPSAQSATASVPSHFQDGGTTTREYLQSMLQLAIKRVTDLQYQMDQPEVDSARLQDYRLLLGDLRVALLRAFHVPSTQEIIRLMSNITTFVPMNIDFESLRLQRISAVVTRPLSNRDTPLDVHPSFPFLIPVEGTIYNIRDTVGIAVQVTFAQNVVRHYYPPADHFTLVADDGAVIDNEQSASASARGAHSPSTSGPSSTAAYRLRTTIEIYPEASWGTSPTELRITLSRSFVPDLVGHDEFICRFAEEIAFEQRQQQQQRPVLQQGSSSDLIGQQPTPPPLQLQQHISMLPIRSLTSPRPDASLGSGSGSGSGSGRPSLSEPSSASSSSFSKQSQSTLEISKSITYYITRRAMFES